MTIAVDLKEAAAESSYLALRKALPQLTEKEIEAGQKESGIAPLCRQNLDERLFMLGLQIMVRELTNPGDTIASAIAKATDLTLVNKFLRALGDEVNRLNQSWIRLDEKVRGQKFKVRGPKCKAVWIDGKFDELKKTIGDDAYAWKVSHLYLSGLEAALATLGKTMNPEEENKPDVQEGPLPPRTVVQSTKKPKKPRRRKP